MTFAPLLTEYSWKLTNYNTYKYTSFLWFCGFIYLNVQAMQHRNSIKSQKDGWLFFFPLAVWLLFPVSVFSHRSLIHAVLRDERATDDNIGEARSHEHHLCSLNAGVTTLYNPPHHLSSTICSPASLLKAWIWRKTRQKTYWAILWARAFLCVLFLSIFLQQLSVSPGTS